MFKNSQLKNYWWMILLGGVMLVFTVFMIFVRAEEQTSMESVDTSVTLLPSDSPSRFSDITITASNDSFEKYFNISKDRISDNTWVIKVSIDKDLLDELKKCYNNITGNATYPYSENMYSCNLTGLKNKYFSTVNVSEQKIKKFINNSRKIPVSLVSGDGYSNTNFTDYLKGGSELIITFNKLNTTIRIGFASITTFLASDNGNLLIHSAFDETTYTQDSGTGLHVADAACLNASNVSDNNRCIDTADGDALDDPYFLGNFTIPGDVNWVNVTVEGQSDAAATCNLALRNFSNGNYKTVATTSCAANTDVTLSYNITNAEKASFINNGNKKVSVVFATSSITANDLALDYMGVLTNYNATITSSNVLTNDSEVFVGRNVSHNATFTTGKGSTLNTYIFAWNASGAGCNVWENTTGSLSGTSQTVSVAKAIPAACAGSVVGWYLWANNSDGKINQTGIQTYSVYQYGRLNVTLSSPGNFSNVSQNGIFWINASVLCSGGANSKCGNVSALAKYNSSGTLPNTTINVTTGATPFYMVGSNTQLSTPIQVAYYTNATSLNDANSVFALGNYVYVASYIGNSLTTFDISNPASPVQVAYYTNATSLNDADSVFALGNYVYVASYTGDSLTTFDISNPASPVQVAYYTNASSINGATSIYALGNRVYIASYLWKSLTTFDISTPSLPVQIAYYTNDTSLNLPRSVFALGDYAYVASYTGDSLTVFNISSGTPVQIGFFSNASSITDAYSVFVSGNYAYVVSWSGKSLTTLDISNPASPVQVTSYINISSMINPVSVFALGNYVYVASISGDSLTTFDVSNPASPVQVAYYTNATSINGADSVFALGNYLYITSDVGDSLTTFQIGSGTAASNPQTSPEALELNEGWNASWQVNATGTDNRYVLNVLFNSSYGSANVPDNFTSNNTFCIGACTAEAPDNIKPTWTNIQNNASTVTPINGDVNWTANLSDETALSFAWLEENATTLVGGLPVLFNQTPIVVGGFNYNVSKKITILMKDGNYTCGRFWFNDTSNNVNVTNWSCFTVAGEAPSLSFTLGYPSSGCTEGQGSTDATAECERCWIQTTNTSAPFISDVNVSCQGQTVGTSFYTVTNTGSVALNIGMKLDATISNKFRHKLSQLSNGGEISCSGNPATGCIYIEDTTGGTVKSNLAQAGTAYLWAWADFNNAGVVDLKSYVNTAESSQYT